MERRHANGRTNQIDDIGDRAERVLNQVKRLQMREAVYRLDRIRDLKKEVDDLSQRIANVEMDLTDPGTRVTGLPGASLKARNKRELRAEQELLTRLQTRRAESMEELGRLYALIDGIADPKTRLIFTHRYIDRMTWQAIAFKIGECDEQVPRRIHERFWKLLINAANSRNRSSAD